jgi:hypothetical protein
VIKVSAELEIEGSTAEAEITLAFSDSFSTRITITEKHPKKPKQKKVYHIGRGDLIRLLEVAKEGF